MGPIRLVGIDGDDTLWRCQDFFDDAAAALRELLSPWATGPEIDEALHEREAANLRLFGYGIKGFTISAVEVAVELSAGAVDGGTIGAVVGVGRRLVEHPVELLPGAEDLVASLSRTHDVVLVTKGDLVDQERKLASSGLRRYFLHVEIVSEKDAATYVELLRTLDCAAEEFLMVGNSERSDIEPVLAVGGWAVHVPYHTTWRRELVAEPSLAHPRRATVVSLSDVPRLLSRWHGGRADR